MKRYFICFNCRGSFGNSMIDVPQSIQTMEHILAIQKMIAEKVKVDISEVCIINYISIQPA